MKDNILKILRVIKAFVFKPKRFLLAVIFLAAIFFQLKLNADTYINNHYIVGINKKLLELEKVYGENFLQCVFLYVK